MHIWMTSVTGLSRSGVAATYVFTSSDITHDTVGILGNLGHCNLEHTAPTNVLPCQDMLMRIVELTARHQVGDDSVETDDVAKELFGPDSPTTPNAHAANLFDPDDHTHIPSYIPSVPSETIQVIQPAEDATNDNAASSTSDSSSSSSDADTNSTANADDDDIRHAARPAKLSTR